MRVDESALSSLEIGGPFRVVLLHGAGPEVTRAVSDTLLRRLAGGRFVAPLEMAGDDHRRLESAVRSPPLDGGPVIVRVRDTPEAIAATLPAALAQPWSGLIVLLAGIFARASKLRDLAHREPSVALIDLAGRGGVRRMVVDQLARRDLAVGADLLDALVSQAEVSGGISEEIEKLALYAETAQPSMDDLGAVLSGGSPPVLDRLLRAVEAGQVARASSAWAEAEEQGVSGVQVARALMFAGQRSARGHAESDRRSSEMMLWMERCAKRTGDASGFVAGWLVGKLARQRGGPS